MMRTLAILLMTSLCGISCSHSTDDFHPEAIVALERGALDRWGIGDPQGFFDIMASDQTYFDPTTAKRIDGQDALKNYFAPFTGKIKIERYEMIDPKVQRSGDLAVLTFNLVSYGAQLDGGPKSTARWNSTEVYQHLKRELEDRPLPLVLHKAPAQRRRRAIESRGATPSVVTSRPCSCASLGSGTFASPANLTLACGARRKPNPTPFWSS
jgi:ketosteroid isomerase-like protein